MDLSIGLLAKSILRDLAAAILLLSFLSFGCISEESGYSTGRHSRDIISYFPKNSRTIAGSSAVLPELKEGAGLHEYLAYAALNNPGLEAEFNKWKAALEKIPQAKSLPDPRFEYRYFIEEVETRVGPQRQSFGISQQFPWFGKLELRGDLAAEEANAARCRYESAKLKLFYEVKQAYYEYYYLAKSVAVTKENISLVRHLEAVAQSRYMTAAGSHPDVIRAQVEAGKLEDRLGSLLDLRQPVAARLNSALDRPLDAELPWPSEIESAEMAIVEEDVIDKMVQENPELMAMDARIRQSVKAVELAKKAYYPDFSIGLNVIDTDQALMSGQRDSGKDPVVASVMINIPIWRDKYDAGVREARKTYSAANAMRRQKANTLGYELKMAFYRYSDSKRKLDLYRDALLPKARESLTVSESAFRAGTGSFNDLVDAQQILLEFDLAYELAMVERAKAAAKIEMLAGKQVEYRNIEKADSTGDKK